MISSCYSTVPSAIWEIVSQFLIFCDLFEIIAKYEKPGKYLSILHKATCGNSPIIRYLLKSNISRGILFINCIKEDLYLGTCLIYFNTNLVQISRSKNCKY